MHPAQRFYGIFLIFLVTCCINGIDPGELKHCFERYNGFRLVGMQPYHSEWRIISEENCLEFCVKTASRCESIVFDKIKHICHYFSEKVIDGNGIIRQPKFVYFQPTSNDCLEKISILIYRNSSMINSEQKVAENVQNMELSTARNKVILDTQKENVQSMNAILDRIDAELREKIDSNSTIVDEQHSKTQITKDNTPFSPAGQSFLNDNKFGIRLQKLVFVKKPAPEIRKHPSRKDYINSGNKIGNDMEEDGFIERNNDQSNKAIEEIPTMIYDCDANSNLIWMSVENSHFNNTSNDDGGIVKKGESAKQCIGICENLKIDNQFPCNAFSFDESKSLCYFNNFGNNFPKSLINSPELDFAQRSFRRFCYPGAFSAFNGCTEFIAFTDYKLELEPRETFEGLPSDAEGISACIELCVLSNGFKCMSGLFDQSKGVCHLYTEHSLSQPDAFQYHLNSGKLYFENGCADTNRDTHER